MQPGAASASASASGNSNSSSGSNASSLGCGGGGSVLATALSLSSRWRRAQGPGAGLNNLGNSCFMNSVIQALAYLPPLGNLCLARVHARSCTLQPGSCVCCKLEEQVARLLAKASPTGGGAGGGYGMGGGAETPEGLHRALPLLNRSFVRGRQEDAHELLRCLVDALERDLLRLEGRWVPGVRRLQCPGTLVNVLFQGSVLNQVKCLACGHESNTWDPIQDLSLEIDRCSCIEEALARFTAPEHLDGSNQYRCDACKRMVSARKQMTIYDDPNVLVVHLKRFDGFHGGKISGHVAFGEELDLTPYLSCRKRQRRRWQRHGGGTQQQQQQQQQDGGGGGGPAAGGGEYGGDGLADVGRSVYRLHGVLVHAGLSAQSGHYYSFVRDGLTPINGWHCANDSAIYRVSWQRVQEQNAYMLFYVRETMKPIAELPRPTEAPQQPMCAVAGSAAGPAPLAGAKRPAPIGPQLPPELLAKRRRAEEEEEEEEGGTAGNGAQIGPAPPPPGWHSSASAAANGGSAAATAAPAADGSGAFARSVPDGSAKARPFARVASAGSSRATGASVSGTGAQRAAPTTRIGGPPLRHLSIKLIPKAPAGGAAVVAAPGREGQPKQDAARPQEKQMREAVLPAASECPGEPGSAGAAMPQQQQRRQDAPAAASDGLSTPPAAARHPVSSPPSLFSDPALVALRKAASAALLDGLRGTSVVQVLSDLARGFKEQGLPLARPSELPAAARLQVQRAVGASARGRGWSMLEEALCGPSQELGAWRQRVEREARAEAAAARGAAARVGGGGAAP